MGKGLRNMDFAEKAWQSFWIQCPLLRVKGLGFRGLGARGS